MEVNTKQRQIKVEVVLATPQLQQLIPVVLVSGSTLAEAIRQSGILGKFDKFDFDPSRVGIFGRKADINQVLRDGDRVEIYRPLIADPKKIRRERAQCSVNPKT